MKAPLRCREQRALRRLMPKRLLVLTVQGEESQPAYGLVNDISDSGAGVVVDRLLPSGREVRIRICFYPQVSFDTDTNPRVALRRWVSSVANANRATMMNGNARTNGGRNGRNAAAFLSKETFGSWVSFLKA